MEPETSPAYGYLAGLVDRAFQHSGFDALCTLLRVGGMSDAGWDPLAEARRAFDDFNALLPHAQARGPDAVRRVQLLIYCHAIEMTAGHELLLNLVRVASGKKYQVVPFRPLARPKKKKSFGLVPPTAKQKFRTIQELASSSGEPTLSDFIAGFFSDHVRNAFSHSDYILGEKHFRWMEGTAKQIAIEKVDELIARCFEFYSSLLILQVQWLQALAQNGRFHKWPQYEVLELLTDESKAVCGFSIHFSNGAKATYERRASGVKAINMRFEKDQTVSFFCGDPNRLEPVHKINGVPVVNWDSVEGGGA